MKAALLKVGFKFIHVNRTKSQATNALSRPHIDDRDSTANNDKFSVATSELNAQTSRAAQGAPYTVDAKRYHE